MAKMQVKFKRNFIQATRQIAKKEIGWSWLCFTPIGVVECKTIEDAKGLAKDFEFENIII